MSRSTQYIGLNDYATRYVKNAIRKEEYEMTTGMFNEPVMGTIYYMPPPAGPNKEYILKETVQVDPWSSGPMIFTHLKAVLIKNNGQEIDMGELFSWMFDPSLKNEFDYSTGRYYI